MFQQGTILSPTATFCCCTASVTAPVPFSGRGIIISEAGLEKPAKQTHRSTDEQATHFNIIFHH
jgi:hypothetical protein